MSQASQLIAEQYRRGETNRRVWSGLIYNVKDYGATGDGITSDVAAIAKAINDATDDSTIWIPDGTYKIDQTLTVTKSLKFTGSGTLLSALPAGNVLEVYQNLPYMLNLKGDWTMVENISFENSPGVVANGAIYFNANNIEIRNCYMRGFTQPLVGGRGYKGFRATNNVIVDVIGVSSENIGDGILSFSRQTVLEGNFIAIKSGTDGRTGATVDLEGDESVITNNTITGFRRPIHVELSPRTVVDSNICLGTSVWGIYVNNSTCTVSNNIVQTAPVSPDPGMNQITVGIYAYQSPYINIIGNNIFSGGTGGRAIRVEGSHANIVSNTFEGGTNGFENLIYTNGSYITISYNRMQSGCVSGRGIDVNNGLFVDVIGNHIEKCGVHGISLRGSNNCKVALNTSINNAVYGIVVESNSHNCVVMGNRCTDNQSPKTQAFGILVGNSLNVIVMGNHLGGNIGALSIDTASQASAQISNNFGMNPVGFQTSPSLPGSGTNLTNPFPYTMRVFITGGTFTDVQIGDNSIGPINSVVLAPGERIKIIYTAAPSWKWYGL